MPPPTQATTHQSLASRMKAYEAEYDNTLPLDKPIILRLDGHAFSRLTSHFARPFDTRIHFAMTSTSSDLLRYFPQATVAYTQSDEITLVFPEGVQSFNERVQKLCSLSASYCSVRFHAHLAAYLQRMPDPPVVLTSDSGDMADLLSTTHFDARLFAVPDIPEAVNNLIWRCRNDAVRNAVSAFARTMFSTEKMHGKKTQQLVDAMLAEKGVRFEDAVPKWAIEGCLIKREQYEHEGVNPKTEMTEKTTRTRTRVEQRGVRVFNEEAIKIVTEKYWW